MHFVRSHKQLCQELASVKLTLGRGGSGQATATSRRANHGATHCQTAPECYNSILEYLLSHLSDFARNDGESLQGILHASEEAFSERFAKLWQKQQALLTQSHAFRCSRRSE